MSKKCKAYSESKLGLEPPDNRKAFYAGWDAALAQQAEPVEPVAWAAVTENGKLYKAASTKKSAERKAEQQEAKFGDTWKPLHVVPLYTAPPQRKPLTDQEIDRATAQARDALLDLIYEYGTTVEGVLERVRKLCRAIERAHGIGEKK